MNSLKSRMSFAFQPKIYTITTTSSGKGRSIRKHEDDNNDDDHHYHPQQQHHHHLFFAFDEVCLVRVCVSLMPVYSRTDIFSRRVSDYIFSETDSGVKKKATKAT